MYGRRMSLACQRTLVASSLDHALATTDAGEVLAVYDRAVSTRTGHGDLVTLAVLDAGNGPNRILVPGSGGDWYSVSSGDAVRLHQGRLHVGSKLMVLLDGAEPWCGKIPVVERPQAAVLADVDWLQRRLVPLAPPVGHEKSLGLRIQLLDTALSHDGLEAITAAVLPLIGFGPGLTPSGDDYLVGLLCGLGTIGRKRASLVGAIRANLDRTTFISGCYLSFACDMRFSQALLDLANTVALGDRSKIDITKKTCLKFGHTSGQYMINGLIRGFQHWGKGPWRSQ